MAFRKDTRKKRGKPEMSLPLAVDKTARPTDEVVAKWNDDSTWVVAGLTNEKLELFFGDGGDGKPVKKGSATLYEATDVGGLRHTLITWDRGGKVGYGIFANPKGSGKKMVLNLQVIDGMADPRLKMEVWLSMLCKGEADKDTLEMLKKKYIDDVKKANPQPKKKGAVKAKATATSKPAARGRPSKRKEAAPNDHLEDEDGASDDGDGGAVRAGPRDDDLDDSDAADVDIADEAAILGDGDDRESSGDETDEDDGDDGGGEASKQTAGSNKRSTASSDTGSKARKVDDDTKPVRRLCVKTPEKKTTKAAVVAAPAPAATSPPRATSTARTARTARSPTTSPAQSGPADQGHDTERTPLRAPSPERAPADVSVAWSHPIFGCMSQAPPTGLGAW